MSELIAKQVDKLLDQKNCEDPLNMAMVGAWILAQFKGNNLKILDVGKHSSLADYFVLASATNSVQARSMVEEIQSQFKRLKLPLTSLEGDGDSDWILLDCGDIIIHIFLESARDIYDLDGLWMNSPRVEIPKEYYYGAGNEEMTKITNEEKYF